MDIIKKWNDIDRKGQFEQRQIELDEAVAMMAELQPGSADYLAYCRTYNKNAKILNKKEEFANAIEEYMLYEEYGEDFPEGFVEEFIFLRILKFLIKYWPSASINNIFCFMPMKMIR